MSLDENMEQSQARQGFARRNGWVLALAGLLTIVAVVSTITHISRASVLEAQEKRIGQIENQVKDAQRETDKRVDTEVMESLGISRARLAADARVMGSLVDVAFTWNSGAAYERARTSLKDNFDLRDNGVFLKRFMPPARYNEDADGKRYYYIDSVGMNSSVGGDPDIAVVSVSADEYHYAVMVTVDVTSDAVDRGDADPERVTAHRSLLLFATVDAEGGVSGLSGVPASGSTRQSN